MKLKFSVLKMKKFIETLRGGDNMLSFLGGLLGSLVGSFALFIVFVYIFADDDGSDEE